MTDKTCRDHCKKTGMCLPDTDKCPRRGNRDLRVFLSLVQAAREACGGCTSYKSIDEAIELVVEAAEYAVKSKTEWSKIHIDDLERAFDLLLVSKETNNKRKRIEADQCLCVILNYHL